jgi:hypothetical protein
MCCSRFRRNRPDFDLTTVDPSGKKTVTHYESGKAYWQEPMPVGAMHKDVNESGKTIELWALGIQQCEAELAGRQGQERRIGIRPAR